MFLIKLKKIKLPLLASLVLFGLACNLKPNNGISIMYLFDVSGSFYESALPSSIELADRVFKDISNQSSGLSVFPQIHQVGIIREQSVNISSQCYVKIDEHNIFDIDKNNPDLEECLKSVSNTKRSKYTDIDGALFNASRALRGDGFYGKGIVIFSDLHEDVPRVKKFTYDLSGVSVFVVHKTSKEQIDKEELIVNDENKLIKKLTDHGVNKNSININTLESITTNPGQVKNFFRKSFKNNR